MSKSSLILRNTKGQFSAIYPLPSVKSAMLATTATTVLFLGCKLLYKKLKTKKEFTTNGKAQDTKKTTKAEINDKPTTGLVEVVETST